MVRIIIVRHTRVSYENPELGVLTAERGFDCVVCALVLRHELWCLAKY